MSSRVDAVRAAVRDSIDAQSAVLADEELLAGVAAAAEMVAGCLRDGGKVLLFGNGGSAADSMHLAAELVGRFRMDRAPLPALSLSDNVSAITAVGNDYGYEHTFARALRALGAPGDVAVGLSTSGTSANVVRAFEAAAELGLRRVAFTGAGGGELPGLADVCLRMPCTDTARVQECTMLLAHTLCELVEQELFRTAAPAESAP
jgi:D-sedoheptulose 7-phosphate isomerase